MLLTSVEVSNKTYKERRPSPVQLAYQEVQEMKNVTSSGVVWYANWAITFPPLFSYQCLL